MARPVRNILLIGLLMAFLSACGYDVLQAHESVVLRGATHDVATLNGGSSDFILLDSDRSDDQEIDGLSFFKPDGSYDGSSAPEYPLVPYAPFGFMFDGDGDGEPEFIVDTRDRENVKILRPDGSEEAKAGTGEDGSVSGVDSDGDGTTDVAVPTPPGVPTGVAASPLDGGASVSFTLPADNGGLPVTDVQVRVDGSGDWVSIGLTSPGSVTGLSNGTEVSLEVRAVNARGGGAPADPVKVTPSADAGATPDAGDGEPAPVAVTGVSIDAAPQRVFDGLTASLSAVVSPAGATDQGVTWSVDDPAVATIDAQSGVLTGITPGATVTVTVTTDDGGYTDSTQVAVDYRALVYEATWKGFDAEVDATVDDPFTFITSSSGTVEVQLRDTAGQPLGPAACVSDAFAIQTATEAGITISTHDPDSSVVIGTNDFDSFITNPNVVVVNDAFIDACLDDAALSFSQGDAYQLFVYDSGLTELGSPNLNSGSDQLTKVVSWGDTALTAVNAFASANNGTSLQEVPDFLPDTVTALRGTFAYTNGLTSYASWDVSNVQAFRGVFANASNIGDLSDWAISSAVTLDGMFRGSDFNSPVVSSWSVNGVQDFTNMFKDTDFNQPLDNWVTSSAVSLRGMFASNDSFDQDLNGWDVSSVRDAAKFFRAADAFTTDFDQWELTSVEDLSEFMYFTNHYTGNMAWTLPSDPNIDLNLTKFLWGKGNDGNSGSNPTGLDTWDVTRVTVADQIFQNNNVFSGDLIGWNTENLTSCSDAFDNANALTQFPTDNCTP